MNRRFKRQLRNVDFAHYQSQNPRKFAGTFMGFAFSPSLNGDSLKTVPSGRFREVKKHHAPCPCGFYYLPMCRILGTAFLPQAKPMQAACRIWGK